MHLHPHLQRSTVAALLAIAALATASGCGGSDSDKIEDLQQQGTQIRESANQARGELQEIQRKIKSGEISAEEGQAEIEKITDSLNAQARATADKALDTASEMNGVPDDVKDQIDEARTELQQQP
jgi:predicted  nucleic acid-binding Zn-ribbon protein